MYDLDRDVRPSTPTRADDATPSRSQDAPRTPITIARSPALDVGSLLHLQRTAGNASVVQMLAADEEEAAAPATSPVHDVIGKGGGQALDEQTRSTMESSFGDRFDDVRIHTGPSASRSAEAVGANAYTVGSEIVVRDGHGPGTADFQRTVAHELEHVRQQKSGPVDGTEVGGGIRLSDPSDRFERAASAKADQVMAGVQASAAADLEAPAPVLQRETPEEDEEELPPA